MITYFKFKYEEWKFKLALLKAANQVLDEKKDIFALIKRLYLTLKDIPAEELQDRLIAEAAGLIQEHAKAESERNEN